MAQEVIIVAVYGIGIDGDGIARFQEDTLRPHIAQGFPQVADEIAEVALAGQGVRPLLPEDGGQLAHGHAGALAVYQIGQQFLGLAPMEGQCLAVGKDVEIPEALEADAVLGLWHDGRAQLLQCLCHGAGVGGLSR